MRLWRLGSKVNSSNAGDGAHEWVTHTPPMVRTGELRPLIMIVGVFMGFMWAIHYADSPRLFSAVEHINEYLDPLFGVKKAPVVIEPDALVVTQDNLAELTAVATLGPRGFRPVPVGSAQDALKVLRDTGRTWKLAVIDSSIPGFTSLPDALKGVIPDGNIIVVQGHKGAQAVSRPVLERLESLAL